MGKMIHCKMCGAEIAKKQKPVLNAVAAIKNRYTLECGLLFL